MRIVQGVGFQLTVFRLASERELAGEVLNDAQSAPTRIQGNVQQVT